MAFPYFPSVLTASLAPFQDQNDDISALVLQETFSLPSHGAGIVTRPISGVRCPTCAAKGQEVWVIPGKACGYCGTPCG